MSTQEHVQAVLVSLSRHFAKEDAAREVDPGVAAVCSPDHIPGDNEPAERQITESDRTGELHRLWRDHVGIRPRYAGRGASASRTSFTASGGTTSAFGRDTLGGGHQQAGR
ncbi:hypothetical protein Bbelb_033190 [Branchiostoma belcheri]|nr:hypothetical protein Bbelb_033190 [Branchiostoma belcheri]